jgi:hypothetical protein
MSVWLLFLLAFLSFFIVGCSLVVLLFPKDSKNKVEQRLLLLASELASNELSLNDRAYNSTAVFESNLHRYLSEKLALLKQITQKSGSH